MCRSPESRKSLIRSVCKESGKQRRDAQDMKVEVGILGEERELSRVVKMDTGGE